MLGLQRRPDNYFKVIKALAHDWKEIDRRALYRSIKKLYSSRLIKTHRNNDGSWTFILTEDGKKKTLTYQIENIKIAPMKKWDGKWRIVLFDVPEKSRFIRDALRRILIRVGFFEYQKSVFVYPFECKDEIDFIIEFFYARPYTRFIVAESLDNEFHLKKHFELI